MPFEELIAAAGTVLGKRALGKGNDCGSVASALCTPDGKVYTGICIDTACGMGFCAEHAAIAAMLTAGELGEISQIVAINERGVIPPCGRCREFLVQVSEANLATEVMVSENEVVTLAELLPYRWIPKFTASVQLIPAG